MQAAEQGDRRPIEVRSRERGGHHAKQNESDDASPPSRRTWCGRSPSGISNYSTNGAVFKDKGSLEFRGGSFGSTREALDYNKILIPGELAAASTC